MSGVLNVRTLDVPITILKKKNHMFLSLDIKPLLTQHSLVIKKKKTQLQLTNVNNVLSEKTQVALSKQKWNTFVKA